MTSLNSFSQCSRREFIAKGAAAFTAMTVCATEAFGAEADIGPRFPLIAFSKPFQKRDAEQTAELVAEVGWDGIEIPVRARGQIEPAQAADLLPRFADELGKRKAGIFLVATDITSLNTPHAELVLRTMATLKIQRFRLGSFTYPPDKPPMVRLKEIAPALKDIADACKDLGLQAGFQNHSGARNVGAPVWDVYTMLQSLDPKQIGFCFDIGHATIEGGLSWPIEARLAEPYYTAVLVKDFYWKKEQSGWKDQWCPLGEGMVNRTFFDRLKRTAYRGPICQHHEYALGDDTEMLAHFKQDLTVLKQWLM